MEILRSGYQPSAEERRSESPTSHSLRSSLLGIGATALVISALATYLNRELQTAPIDPEPKAATFKLPVSCQQFSNFTWANSHVASFNCNAGLDSIEIIYTTPDPDGRVLISMKERPSGQTPKPGDPNFGFYIDGVDQTVMKGAQEPGCSVILSGRKGGLEPEVSEYCS